MVGGANFCVVVVFNNVITIFAAPRGVWLRRQWILGPMAGKPRYVVLPNLSSALLAGGMLAFALSFDEIIVTDLRQVINERYRCGCSIGLGDRVMYR